MWVAGWVWQWQWQWQWNNFIETQAYKDYALMHNYTVIIRKSDT